MACILKLETSSKIIGLSHFHYYHYHCTINVNSKVNVALVICLFTN